jgi:signal peptidase
LKSGAEVGEVMTADEDRRSSHDDDPSVDDAVPPSPSTPTADAVDGESTRSDERNDTGPFEAGTESGGGSDPEAGTKDSRDGRPDPVPGREGEQSFVRRLWTARSGPLFFLREVGTSVGAVVLVGLVLFGISGVWPPMVAVESGSMEPHMHRGDLVFITEPGRYTPDAAYGQTGVVTAEAGVDADYRTFGGPGSVVVYDDPDRGGPPIIHRAEFYVQEGENWYDRADPEFVSADGCEELRNCPAPHAGFITKGDANARYDQVSGIAEPVKPSWITGIARVRIPYLGWVRLGLSDVVRTGPYGVVSPTAESSGVDRGVWVEHGAWVDRGGAVAEREAHGARFVASGTPTSRVNVRGGVAG